MIKAENITKQFNDHVVVDHISLDVAESEVFGFLGPNGAGKTTTVRVLAGLVRPTSGTAYINNIQIGTNERGLRKSIGILTETPGFYDSLSAEHNLRLYATLYEVENAEKQIQKYLELMGLWNRRKDRVASYSKGMKQKLAIIRALFHEPKVVFLDEPTSGLDPEAIVLVRECIEELRQQKRTVFLCTHHLDEAEKWCDRIAVFKRKLLVLDTPSNLRSSLGQAKTRFRLSRVDTQVVDAINREFQCDANLDGDALLVSCDPKNHNPQIIRWLDGMGIDVYFADEISQSLESVYLKLVRGE